MGKYNTTINYSDRIYNTAANPKILNIDTRLVELYELIDLHNQKIKNNPKKMKSKKNNIRKNYTMKNNILVL